MPDKNAVSQAAHVTAVVPVGVTGMHMFGIPLSEWAYIAAIVSGIFCVFAYSVKMWRDFHIGMAARHQRMRVTEEMDE